MKAVLPRRGKSRVIGTATRFALGVLVISFIAFVFALTENWGRSDMLDAELGITNGLQNVVSNAADIESGARGFVLTGEEAFLEPYRNAIDELPRLFSDLENRWPEREDPGDLQAVHLLADAQAAFEVLIVDVRRRDGFEDAAALVRSREGKARMDALRAASDELQEAVQGRVAAIDRQRNRSSFVAALAFVGAMLSALALAGQAFRRQIEARRTSALLNGVLSNAPVGIGFLDRDLKVTQINSTLDAAGEGETPADTFEGIFPQERDRLRTMLAETLGRGTRYQNVELLRHLPQGERTYLASFYPLYAEQEVRTVPTGVGFVIMDATDVQRAEKQRRESETRFRMLADNIPQMTWIAEPNGEIRWYNQRWFDFTGTTQADVDGFGWEKVHHPDHLERASNSFKQQIADGKDWEDTFPLRAADGSYRWFLSRAVPIRENGQIVRWFGTNTDVTRQRAAEQELSAARDAAEEANRAKSQFIANMSHELRTPLTAVIGYAEMLEEEVEDVGADSLLPDLRKINQNARHLLNLINNVLDLSKIEAERMDVHVEPFSVSDIAEEVASSVQSLMEKKANTLVLELEGDLGEMASDDTKLRQCLLNLLSNASKFTENGTVRMRVTRQADPAGDTLTFAIKDSGIGMSAEQLENLFERFTQADSSTTRRFGGTGLGLAITRAFCRLLGGDIAVTSEEGVGSTFTITLPAKAPETVDDEGPFPIAPEARAASAGLVLAIDDDPNARELVERFLTREGFIVRTAADGVAGLQAARDLRPDIILLDITMPRLDGWSVLAELKADVNLSHVPVVMLSIIDEHSLGYARGAADYLTKPVEWNELRRVMDNFRTGENTSVLVVDDDPHIRDLMTTMLEREGLSVTTAENGRVALDALASLRPGLILLDLVMPEMDGFGFLRALRQREYLDSIPVVVLTSKDLSREEFRRLRQDSDKVVSKGDVELRELAEEIRVVLEKGGVPRKRRASSVADKEIVE